MDAKVYYRITALAPVDDEQADITADGRVIRLPLDAGFLAAVENDIAGAGLYYSPRENGRWVVVPARVIDAAQALRPENFRTVD